MVTVRLLNLTSSVLHTVSILLSSVSAGNEAAGTGIGGRGGGGSGGRSYDMTAPAAGQLSLLVPTNHIGDGRRRIIGDKIPQEKTLNLLLPDLLPSVKYLAKNPILEVEYLHQSQSGSSDGAEIGTGQAAAYSVFVKVLPHIFNDVSAATLAPGEREVNFYDDQAIATVQIDSRNYPLRCNILEVNTPEERRKALDKFAQEGRPVEKSTFKTLLGIITACALLDPDDLNFPQGGAPPRSQENRNLPRAVLRDPDNIRSVTSGILPGTKWCGLGAIAKNYTDLGQERKVDKCCRAHDYCPAKVKAFRSAYGLVNWSLYTKSHCQCDALLYDCLKNAKSQTGDILGNVYFNLARIQCVEEEDPVTCVQREEGTRKCMVWQPVPGQPPRMAFRNVVKEF